MLHTEWRKQQKSSSHISKGWKSKIKLPARKVSFSYISSWLVGGHHLTVSSHDLFVCAWEEKEKKGKREGRVSSVVILLIKTPILWNQEKMKVSVTQLGLTLCNPIDNGPPGTFVHGFPRQEYWSGYPFPSPGDLPDSGIEPRSPALQANSLLSEPPGKPMRSRPHLYDLV